MDSTMVVLAVLAAALMVLTVVAFYRGWFRLASLPVEERMQFILMRKKDKSNENEKNTAMSPQAAGQRGSAKVTPPDPPAELKD